MDSVTVTPEVERRVLAGLQAALDGRRAPARRWQPRLAAACAALVICAAAGFPLWLDSRTPAETPPVQVTWSAQQFESTGELAEQLSYPLLLPAWLPEGYTLESARCLQGELAEVCWQADGQTLTYRMAPGDGDVSGDFTAYSWEEELSAGAYTVACKGEKGLVFLAVWSGGTYSFSLHASVGLTVDQVTALIESIGT